MGFFCNLVRYIGCFFENRLGNVRGYVIVNEMCMIWEGFLVCGINIIFGVLDGDWLIDDLYLVV